MSSEKFKRKIEDFVCENCGAEVRGDGYTNHCPKCLWSKHVDVHPGDRGADCGGMMKPERVEIKSGEYFLRHVCQKCGHNKINKVQTGDNFEEAVKIAKN